MNNEIVVKLEKESNALVERANQIDIKNQEDYKKAGAMVVMIKGLLNEVKSTFDPIVKKAHDTWKEATTQKGKYLNPLERAERTIKAKLVNWELMQRREAEKQEKLRQAEEEKKARKEKERLAKQAETAEKNGQIEKAEALKEQAESVDTPIHITEERTQPDNLSYRKDWFAEVIDLRELAKAVATGKVPANYITANIVALNKQAKATQDNLMIPGVKFKYRLIPSINTKK